MGSGLQSMERTGESWHQVQEPYCALWRRWLWWEALGRGKAQIPLACEWGCAGMLEGEWESYRKQMLRKMPPHPVSGLDMQQLVVAVKPSRGSTLLRFPEHIYLSQDLAPPQLSHLASLEVSGKHPLPQRSTKASPRHHHTGS